jgi:Ca-activated chloride channel family protein
MLPTWTNPWWLLLALLVPPLVWWMVHQPRTALKFSATTGLAALPGGRRTSALWGAAVLRGLGLLLLVVALAGPRWPDERTRVATEGIALMMVVDVSGSMAEPDFVWQGERVTRLDAVKKVFRLFVEGGQAGGQTFEGRLQDHVALVAFASRAKTLSSLTLDHGMLLRALDAESPRQIPGQSQTNISDAMVEGLGPLEAVRPRRGAIVFLSDGENTEKKPVSEWSVTQAGQLARALGWPIYAIDAGGGAGAVENRTVATEEERIAARERAVQDMKELARATNGQYFPASDTQALLDACHEIDALERHTLESYQYRRWHEGFAWFATASFALFVAVGVLELTLWRKVP